MLLELLKDRWKAAPFQFEIFAAHVEVSDSGYSANEHYLKSFCEDLNIPFFIERVSAGITGMDADLVYKMTKAVYENLAEVQKVSALLKQFTPNLVLPDDQMLIPYHPGARKYFVEKGWLK